MTAAAAPVWEQLEHALNPANARPQLRQGVTAQDLTTAQGEQYAIVRRGETDAYLKLQPDELFVMKLMDGTRTVQDLVVQYMLQYRKFALERVQQLVDDLERARFLESEPRPVWGPLHTRLQPQRFGRFSEAVAASVFRREFPIRGADRLMSRAYELGGWVLFTRPVKVVLVLMTALGLPALTYRVAHGLPLAGGSLALGLPLYYGFAVLVAMIHELGHAFAVKSYGRVVRRGGVSIFYGSPALFVDTQDIWMEPRRARLVVSWAGPYSGFCLAGVTGLVALALPGGGLRTTVLTLGLSAVGLNLFQLMPLIQLDGYYMVMDWLEMPNLRQRALAFVRHELIHKLRRRERFDRQDRILTIFGALAAAYFAYIIFIGTSFAWVRASRVISRALEVHSFGQLLLAAWLIALFAPFVFVTYQRGRSVVRGGVLTWKRAQRLVAETRYREQVVALAAVPSLGALGKAEVQWLARRAKRRTYASGRVVLPAGRLPQAFRMILAGEAEVVAHDDGEQRVVARLRVNDYFPLVSDPEELVGVAGTADVVAPAATSVRAVTPLTVLELRLGDAVHGLRHLAHDEGRLRRHAERAELDEFTFLDGLGTADKDALLAALEPAERSVGETIVTAGEPANHFYLVRDGLVAVKVYDEEGEAHTVRELAKGDYFGETALLMGAPHTETVVAVDDTSLWVLGRQRFNDLLCRYFGLGNSLESASLARLGAEQAAVADGARTRWLDVEVGDEAPDFCLESVQGARVRLSEMRGGTVVLWFSRGYNCPYCRQYQARLTGAVTSLSAAGASILQVAPNLVASSRRFWEGRELPFPFLCDPEKSAYLLCGLADLGAGEANRNTVKGFAKAFAVRESGLTCKAILLDVMNREMGGRLRHHALTATQQGVFVIDCEGVIRNKFVFGPLDEPPSNDELVAAVRLLQPEQVGAR